MEPIGPMSRALYRLTGVPAPMEHRAAVEALNRRAERGERRPPPQAGRVRLIECAGPPWRQP